MDFNRRALLSGGVGAAALAATSDAGAAVRRVGGSRAHARAMTTLERYVEQHRTDWGIPGMTVCVVTRDGFTGFITAGYANKETREPVGPNHLFQVGSISKVFTALTLWSMAQEGRISTQTLMSDLMPEAPIANGRDITLQHLLNHTSGLPADPPLFPEGGLWSGYAPGSHWSYSNVGYQMAGLTAARRDERLLHEAIEQRVLRPLGMNNSTGGIFTSDRARYAQGYETLLSDRAQIRPGEMRPSPWVDSDSGAGCVSATASDMALFLRFLLDLGQGRGGAVFSDATAAAFLANPADAPGWAEGAKYGNGLARVRINERDYLHHTGGMVSFCSSMHVDVAAGVAAFASTNVHYGLGYRPRGVTILACELMRMIQDGGPEPTPAPTRAVLPDVQPFVGVYTAASGESFELRANGDSIVMRYNGRDSETQPVAPIAFACNEPRFSQPGLIFDIEDDKIVRAWVDDEEFVRDVSKGYLPPAPPELRAFAGMYVNDDRWGGNISVVARKGGLWLGNFTQLTRLPDGSWRAGEEDWSPERARFDGMVDGHATRFLLSGAPYVRRFS